MFYGVFYLQYSHEDVLTGNPAIFRARFFITRIELWFIMSP
jgi:hypothetical protein